jgi:hypothetical protein
VTSDVRETNKQGISGCVVYFSSARVTVRMNIWPCRLACRLDVECRQLCLAAVVHLAMDER